MDSHVSNGQPSIQADRRVSQTDTSSPAGERVPYTNPLHSATERLPSNLDHFQHESPSSSGVADSVIRTVVSTGNDALNILFEAASRDPNPIANGTGTYVHERIPQQMSSIGTSPSDASSGIPSPGSEVLKTWETCRFVTMGWLTAKDAVMYIDLYVL